MTECHTERENLVAISLAVFVLTGSFVGLIGAAGVASAGDGVSDLQWSGSGGKVYDLDECRSGYVGETKIDEDAGWTMLQGWDLNGASFKPYVDDVAVGFYAQISSKTSAELDSGDDYVRWGWGYDDTSITLGTAPGEGVIKSNYDDGSYVTVGETFDRVLTDVPVERFTGNEYVYALWAKVMGNDAFDSDHVYLTYRDVKYCYWSEDRSLSTEFTISDKQFQSLDGPITLKYTVTDTHFQDGGSSYPLRVFVNGQQVDTVTSTGQYSVEIDPSLLGDGGTYQITVKGDDSTGSDDEHADYGYTVDYVAVSASTDGDFDDDGLANWNDPYPDQTDGDGDGIADADDPYPKDKNGDDDALNDPEDPCPKHANCDGVWRQDGQTGESTADLDGDGTVNLKDANNDDDGWTDDVDPTPLKPNADATWSLDGVDGETKDDIDGDGTANYADTDNDGDSLVDGKEASQHGTDPAMADTDGDSYDDGAEVSAGTSPTSASDHPTSDADKDGLSDSKEQSLGTSPTTADTDRDSLDDGPEVNQHGTDPAIADTDDDSYDDGVEVSKGTSPTDASDYPTQGGGNTAPSAAVSANATSVSVGSSVTLDASGSTDADGDSLTYTWSVVSAPGGTSVTLPSDASGDVTLPANGEYTFQVTVSDGNATDMATVTISATASDSGGTTIKAERTLASSTVSPGGSVEVTTTVTFPRATSRISIAERFSPAISSARIVSTTVDGSGSIVFSTADTSGVDVAVQDLTAGSTVTVTYSLSLPKSATSGTTYSISGEAMTKDRTATISSDTVTVREGLGRFAGSDGRVDTADLREVIQSWVLGDVETSLLRDAIRAWVMQSPV